jgi:uncharacterized surface protein with fasciclin (FAS1) repeats
MQAKTLLMTVAALAVLAGPALAQTASDAPPPPSATIPTAQLAASGDILDTLKANGQFSILVKALAASGLSSVMERPGPFTLMAPTDAAFQALPPAQLADLLKPENAAQLQALLAYHLINAAVPPTKIEGTKGPIQTVAGHDVQIDASANPAKVNDADVEGDVHVSNGYIYVVNKVLSPTPMAAAAPAAPAG